MFIEASRTIELVSISLLYSSAKYTLPYIFGIRASVSESLLIQL